MIALITGGASCGKSAFAEQLCTRLGGDLVYLAAMRPYTAEGRARVARHRAQRAGKGFRTVECYEELDTALDGGAVDGATVLLECLGNVVANNLFSDAGEARDPAVVRAGVESGVALLSERSEHLIVVGNEIGSDGTDYGDQTLMYQRLLGSIACRVAAQSDLVAEVVAGAPSILVCSEAAQLALGPDMLPARIATADEVGNA